MIVASLTDKIHHSCAIIKPTKSKSQDRVCGYRARAIKMDGKDKKPKFCNRKIDTLSIFSLFLNITLICYVVYGSVSQQKTNLIFQQTDESLRQDIDVLKQVSPANSTDMHCRYMRSVKVYVSLVVDGSIYLSDVCVSNPVPTTWEYMTTSQVESSNSASNTKCDADASDNDGFQVQSDLSVVVCANSLESSIAV